MRLLWKNTWVNVLVKSQRVAQTLSINIYKYVYNFIEKLNYLLLSIFSCNLLKCYITMYSKTKILKALHKSSYFLSSNVYAREL